VTEDSGEGEPVAHAARTAAILLVGALVIGTLDIVYAMVFWHFKAAVAPTRIFQSVAAGIYGKASFTGGARTAAIGAALHYFISLCIVLVYWLASKRFRSLTERPIVYGAIYGVVVYFVMNYVVIPLSATQRGKFLFSWVALTIIVHAFLIGVPAALTARAALRSGGGSSG
jgi:hypothetical protein